jgi:hypothetical protein
MLLMLAMLAFLSPFARAQGCTMCYTAAAAQSEKGKAALNAGIFWLLTPAIGIFCGVVILARKHRAWWEKE